MKYNFLIFSLLFLIPGTIVFLMRKDLRKNVSQISAISLPFALSEFLFYPEYWEPDFLFDLGARIGFGLEDILFVMGLGVMTSCAYLFTFSFGFESIKSERISKLFIRAALLYIAVIGLLLATLALSIHPIYSVPAIMTATAVGLVLWRKDLLRPAVLGGMISGCLYLLICIAFGALVPNAFISIWHTDKFLNFFFLGVPVEEIIYGFSAGCAAPVIYPYLFNLRYKPLRRS